MSGIPRTTFDDAIPSRPWSALRRLWGMARALVAGPKPREKEDLGVTSGTGPGPLSEGKPSRP